MFQDEIEDLNKEIIKLEKELTELKLERAKQRVKQLKEEIELEKLLPFESSKIYPVPLITPPWWKYPDQTWMCNTNPLNEMQSCTKSYNQD